LKRLNKWLIKLLQALLSVLKRSAREYTPKTHQKDKMPTNKNTEVKGVNLLLLRDTFTDESTIGELFVDGERFCDTLELPYKDNLKVYRVFQSDSIKSE